jgi:hypothetical protein
LNVTILPYSTPKVTPAAFRHRSAARQAQQFPNV